MKAKNEMNKPPVRPYDDSMWDRYSLYDMMPYVWDPDLNVEKVFVKVTGNIIKGYRCKTIETFEVNNR